MRTDVALPVILAQDGAEDLRRDAGLRGDAATKAIWALSAVFLLGLLVLAAVILSGRRRKG